MKKNILIMLVILSIFCFLTACDKNNPTPSTIIDSAGETTTNAAEETIDPELNDPNRDWEPIDTKFGRLRYPDDLFEYLQTNQTETEDSVSVLFTAEIQGNKIDLFEIVINSEAEQSAGKITGPDGVQREVHMNFIQLNTPGELSDGETDRLYAMQEALNFVLDHLK